MATKPASPKKPAAKATPKKAPVKKPVAKAKPVDETKPAKAPIKKSQSPEEVKAIRAEVKAVKAVQVSGDIDAMSAVAMMPATQPVVARAITSPGERGNYVVKVIEQTPRPVVGAAPKKVGFNDLFANRHVAPRAKDATAGWKTR